MRQYKKLLTHVLNNGTQRGDRTGTGTISTFGYQMRFDLSNGFPLLTTKRIHLKSVIHELLWFLMGDTNVKYLNDNGVHIWDSWKSKNGDLGLIYGRQWVNWNNSINQIEEAVKTIKNDPFSRRIIVSAWNVSDLPYMALPPCHLLFQFYVSNGKLSLQLYQRSGDVFLGIPFNIASYSLLLMMMAQVTGLEVGEFIHTIGDAHLYSNHIEQAKLQLSRDERELPTMKLNSKVTDIFDFKYDDFELVGYNPHPTIKGEVAV